MFASTLYLQAIQFLVSGPPGSVGHGWAPFHGVGLNRQAIVWSFPQTLSHPPLTQHILQTGQVVDQKFCGWMGV